MPSYTPQDLSLVKQQMVQVYTPGGAFISTLPDAPLLSGFKEAINSAPQQLVFTLPRKFDFFDEGGAGGLGTIAQGNIIQFWLYGPGLPVGGKLRYQGVIDKYQPKVDQDGRENLEVTLTPYGSQLGDVGVIGTWQHGSATATTSTTAVTAGTHTIVIASATGLVQGAYIPIDTGVNLEYVIITTLSGTNLTATFTKSHSGTYSVGGTMDPVVMFNAFFNAAIVNAVTGNAWGYPLFLNGSSLTSSAATPSWYTFQNQTLLSIFQTILVMLATDTPNWFFRINPDKSVLLSKTPVTAQNQLAIAQHFASVAYTKDWTLLKNIIVRVGNTPSVSASATGSDIATFGQRTDMASDVRITTNAMAAVLATGTLALEDQVNYRGVYTVIDYRGDLNIGLGYDIETLAVGQSISIINLSAPYPGTGIGYSTDASVVQIVGLSYRFDAVVLELAKFGPSVTATLSQLAQQVQDFTIIP